MWDRLHSQSIFSRSVCLNICFEGLRMQSSPHGLAGTQSRRARPMDEIECCCVEDACTSEGGRRGRGWLAGGQADKNLFLFLLRNEWCGGTVRKKNAIPIMQRNARHDMMRWQLTLTSLPISQPRSDHATKATWSTKYQI